MAADPEADNQHIPAFDAIINKNEITKIVEKV
jgi:hypothetical protein